MEKNDFIASVLKYYRKNGYLSDRQFSPLKDWYNGETIRLKEKWNCSVKYFVEKNKAMYDDVINYYSMSELKLIFAEAGIKIPKLKKTELNNFLNGLE